MKKILFLLLALTLSSIVSATDLTLSWAAPTSFTDGTAIPSTTAISYNVYGAVQGQPLVVLQSGVTALSNVRSNVSAGTRCYAVSAVVNGNESAQTAPICVTVNPPPPAAPTTLTCSVVVTLATGSVTGACKSP